ncbi:MAG: 5'/3'-nucleotidase SurE [Bacteroidales bacterium]|jgi:5'-nucleotidase|nr:5'/3'-nucleotidase SurE [Bacteroidales bacterium]
MKTLPSILITNDDSIHAPGLRALIEAATGIGELFVVAPENPQSGMGHAITVTAPLRFHPIFSDNAHQEVAVSGTPVDCVKLGEKIIMRKRPDLLLSGINHGSNASINVMYSGTMAATLEGCMSGIPSVGFSLCDYSHDANFEYAIPYVRDIIQKVLKHGLPDGVCLNVNIPAVKGEELKGYKVCRQGLGSWKEEFDERKDPRQRDYFWITGRFNGYEMDEDTDNWALANNYISVVPVKFDLTAHQAMDHIKKMTNDVE